VVGRSNVIFDASRSGNRSTAKLSGQTALLSSSSKGGTCYSGSNASVKDESFDRSRRGGGTSIKNMTTSFDNASFSQFFLVGGGGGGNDGTTAAISTKERSFTAAEDDSNATMRVFIVPKVSSGIRVSTTTKGVVMVVVSLVVITIVLTTAITITIIHYHWKKNRYLRVIVVVVVILSNRYQTYW